MRILLFFIMSMLTFAVEPYVPQSEAESITLDKYRSQELTLIVEDLDYSLGNESVNSILKEMFQDYLQLNVKVRKRDPNNLKGHILKENEIVCEVFQTGEHYKNIKNSIPLYNEDLYIVFNGKNISNEQKQKYNQLLKFYLVSNKLRDLVSENQKEKIKRGEFYLVPTNIAIEEIEKIKISKLPSRVVGVANENDDLLPIINNAIKLKYYDKINNFLEKRKYTIENNLLLSMLSDSEKEYLENHKTIHVGLESNQVFCYYLKESGEYYGALVTLLHNLSNVLKVEFKITTDHDDNWEDILKMFDENKIQIIPMVKTTKRMTKYLFSRNLMEVYIYDVLKYHKLKDRINYKIGVLKDSFEEEYVNLYFDKDQIFPYINYEELNRALENDVVDKIYTLNIENNKNPINLILEEEKFPLVFAFHKNDFLLKNIINKALLLTQDLSGILYEGEANKKYLSVKAALEKERVHIGLFYGVLILGVCIVILLVKLYIQSQKNKKLLTDKLTFLPNNYRYLEDAKTFNHSCCSLIRLKINNLIEINEKISWDIGDEIILKVTDILKEVFNKQHSIIYRVSGEKFYIITNDKNIWNLINQVSSKIKLLKFKEVYDLENEIKLSFYQKNKDISTMEGFEYLEILAEDIDEKNIGVVELNNKLLIELNRKNKIKRLLLNEKTEGIYPVFQPKFSLKDKTIIGAEALARWEDKELGTIYPNEFIPLAEKMKIVHIIDYKIAEETLKFIKKIPKKYLDENNFRISFNISLQTFEQENFLKILETMIKKYEVDTKYIEVELTETVLGLNMGVIIEKIKRLRERNIAVSIDDFTAGNASFSFLSILPINTIKFDKSILDLVPQNSSANKIYEGLINIIKMLDFKIVAEGIETVEQSLFLKKNGVTIGQGYLFSRPLSEKIFLKLLDK